MPLPVAGDGQGVDRVGAAGAAKRRDQEPARCLDRHRDQGFRCVPGLGQQLQELREALDGLLDALLGDQAPVLVDERDVVVAFGPVDPVEHPHGFSAHQRQKPHLTCGETHVERAAL